MPGKLTHYGLSYGPFFGRSWGWNTHRNRRLWVAQRFRRWRETAHVDPTARRCVFLLRPGVRCLFGFIGIPHIFWGFLPTGGTKKPLGAQTNQFKQINLRSIVDAGRKSQRIPSCGAGIWWISLIAELFNCLTLFLQTLLPELVAPFWTS